ncbi:hypothetical protein [Actinoplanes sp. NBRC 103695]|uniref:hypothetical protein n=1 Tax=Actinoplanes sp. NBRC 103695 TaxID=3032202 RepID=UPI0024A362C4|nr:hypothetical protein [Actinoplanes sp. NBRC 103695]GLY99670.1 hypothetical protein Acsp02_69230 [Actinoplanes sp. NBRC 103695]
MTDTTTTLSAASAEAIEAGFMSAYVTGAPAANGAAVTRIGGGVVLAMRHDTAGYWNKALGFTEPLTARLVDEIIDFYRAHGVTRATLQVRPDVTPDDWERICRVRGIADSGGRIVKLSCRIEETTPGNPTDLDIAPVTAADAEEWAGVVLDAFGFPHEGQLEMFAASAGDPCCQPYAAWATDPATGERRIVAGANMYLAGDVAALNAGATHAGFRGRGAQAALIDARIEAARLAGCRWVVAETSWSDEQPRHASLNNMRRAGLRPNYIRPNWRWTAPAA